MSSMDSSPSGLPRFRHSPQGWIAPLAFTTVALLTPLVLLGGPSPHQAAAGSPVRDLAGTLIKPADQAALAGWIALTLALAFFSISHRRLARQFFAESRVLTLMLAGSALIATLGVMWGFDPTKLWFGISFEHILIGTGLATAALAVSARPKSRWRLVLWLGAILVLALAVGTWVQTPSTLIDEYHFKYTSDELASVAAGHFPLNDYVPQYSNLLPFLFALPIALAPNLVAPIVLVGILLLQAATIALMVGLTATAGGRQHLPAALIVCLSLAFAPATTSGDTPASYFQSMPLRYFLPLVTIFCAFMVLRRPTARPLRQFLRVACLGALAGLAALNNPDFGLPVLVVLLVMLVLVSPALGMAAIQCAAALAGSLIPFLLYTTIGATRGTSANWTYFLLFQQTFGLSGLMNVQMFFFGLYTPIVALFITAAATGFFLVRRRGAKPGTRSYDQGVALGLAGGWALLTLPYLTGRSLPATYLGTYSIPSALLICLLLPKAAAAWRWARARSWEPHSVACVLLPTIALGVAIAVSLSFPQPGTRIQQVLLAGPVGKYQRLVSQQEAVASAVSTSGRQTLGDQIKDGGVVQILDLANLTSLAYGVPAVNVSSSPEYIESTTVFAQIQCARPLPPSARYLLLKLSTAIAMQTESACATYLDWHRAQTFVPVTGAVSESTSYVLAPVQPR